MWTEFGIVRVYVHVDILWDRVNVCTCGQSLLSCECLYKRKEFGIVRVYVHVNRVWDLVSVCWCGQLFGLCEWMYV